MQNTIAGVVEPLFFTSPPAGDAKLRSACPSLRSHISKTTYPDFTKFLYSWLYASHMTTLQCNVMYFRFLWTTSCLHTVGQAIPTRIGRVVGVANQGQHGFHTAGSKTDMMTSSTIFILQCAKTLAHIWRYSCDKAVRRRKGIFSTVRGIFSYSVQ